MKDDILRYYDQELSYFYSASKEFARAHPGVATQLLLEPDRCDDPHVERLIQSFAFIAGRIQKKLDDEFPEITESFLEVLYPHYLRPIPSLSIARFELDPEQAQVSAGYPVARHSAVYSRNVTGEDAFCTFRTCYPVTLWPFAVSGAWLRPAGAFPEFRPSGDATHVIKIDLSCPAGKAFLDFGVFSELRFFLNGSGAVVYKLFEALMNLGAGVSVQTQAGDRAARTVRLGAGAIAPVGFDRGQELIPYPDRSFVGYRLVQEYFAFPQKFLFFDLKGLDRIERTPGFSKISIFIEIAGGDQRDDLQQLERGVNRETFQLGCTPIVNLFERQAEPIRVTHTKPEYLVLPDIHRRMFTEVYSIGAVSSSVPYHEKSRHYAPFYSVLHGADATPASAFWLSKRRPANRAGDAGTDVFISLVNGQFEPVALQEETLSLDVTCTNRDLAHELTTGGGAGELQLEAGAVVKARLLVRPTKCIRPSMGRSLHWRLISHLALNHLSIVEGGKEALQEILALYNFTEDPAIRREISGIAALSSRATISRLLSPHGIVFAQGVRVEVELEAGAFPDNRSFLFASVLERFFGLYSAMNSFSQTVLRSSERKEVIKQWPPRCGEQILL